MSALATTPAYTALLLRFPPRVIRSQEQNDSYIEALHQLEEKQGEWNAEEEDLAELLTLLIEDFENKQYALPKSSPHETLSFLMDQHGLRTQDLAGVLGTDFSLQETLASDHSFTRSEIEKLSAYFHVSPEVFF